MIIYGALLIPLITAFILYIYFSHETVWWEFFVPLTVSAVLIFSAKAIIDVVEVESEEYYGSLVDRVEYYEAWDEYIHRTCTRSCGKNCMTTYDCSYVDYHQPYWQIVTTTGEVVRISQVQYMILKRKFENENFVELNRSYHTIDGNEYCCNWKRQKEKATAVTTVHNYSNRVKSADQSVFHFREVLPADVIKYQLKDYPKITDNYKMKNIVGDSGYDSYIAESKFDYLNGLLGHKKEVRVFVLVYKNQPIEAALYQEWYWSGANMNEFVICVGVDNARNVKWCKILSWTRSEILKAEVQDFVQSQKKLNLRDAADFTMDKVEKQFVRRDFEEFNYLTVEPPTWAIILTYVLTIIVNLGISIWVIGNEHNENDDRKTYRRSFR